MRGQYPHNGLLVDPLNRAFQACGALPRSEAATNPGRSTGYIDLLVDLGSRRIAIEAERSAKRVANDLAKAARVNADELWIVVPNTRVAKAVRRKLIQLTLRLCSPGILVLTLGQALQRVSDCFPLISGPKVPGKQFPARPPAGGHEQRRIKPEDPARTAPQ